MRNYIVLFFIPLVFACEKRKEKKFTGTFEGIRVQTSEVPEIVDGFPVGSITTVDSSSITVKVVREENYIFMENYPDKKIDLNKVGYNDKSVWFDQRGGGGKVFTYSITKEALSYRHGFNYHDEHEFMVTFSGKKIE